jgi:hypothetical protein
VLRGMFFHDVLKWTASWCRDHQSHNTLLEALEALIFKLKEDQ